MASDVPQWLLDNLTALDTKISKTNEQLTTVISLIGDLRVKEATFQSKLDIVARHEESLDGLKRQELVTLADLATIKVHVTNCDTMLSVFLPQ